MLPLPRPDLDKATKLHGIKSYDLELFHNGRTAWVDVRKGETRFEAEIRTCQESFLILSQK